jgi:hypothetical protein
VDEVSRCDIVRRRHRDAHWLFIALVSGPYVYHRSSTNALDSNVHTTATTATAATREAAKSMARSVDCRCRVAVLGYSPHPDNHACCHTSAYSAHNNQPGESDASSGDTSAHECANAPTNGYAAAHTQPKCDCTSLHSRHRTKGSQPQHGLRAGRDRLRCRRYCCLPQ